jgi:hypothetical protein
MLQQDWVMFAQSPLFDNTLRAGELYTRPHLLCQSDDWYRRLDFLLSGVEPLIDPQGTQGMDTGVDKLRLPAYGCVTSNVDVLHWLFHSEEASHHEWPGWIGCQKPIAGRLSLDQFTLLSFYIPQPILILS